MFHNILLYGVTCEPLIKTSPIFWSRNHVYDVKKEGPTEESHGMIFLPALSGLQIT